MVDSYQKQLDQVSWSLCGLAIFAVSARCYCRICVLRKFGWDDGFMVVALGFGLCMSVLVSVAVQYGYGLHVADITDTYRREQALKYVYIAPAPCILSSTAAKISMVFFLLRLLGHSATKRHRWVLYIVTGIRVALNVFIIPIIVGQCSPIEKSWKPWVPGKCLDSSWLNIGGRLQAIWNAVVDLVTAIIPVYMVWKLQLKTSTKWGLSSLMGGGIL
ncbi:hypothetical protein P153DRAFT_303213 [Dothidotthia symphoricarpi CBS 119687]|uniref:Rhodopsin domain-containing protein n=1 Tax=Dothidotthia symphoricarpi CBS 119687 TaxID=1392245 RepID=A0A6A5ZX53_9PLEO|nr:uncharacterized protein P153DRAFT_303213 [Dothidotthia symphoricarpi CBS 119687]KAF2123876.1 hypothetical protein P153DRAFT_303213 [Dothidotthia symphoricarpi CBS 119687]